jgi:hypothetical protein
MPTPWASAGRSGRTQRASRPPGHVRPSLGEPRPRQGLRQARAPGGRVGRSPQGPPRRLLTGERPARDASFGPTWPWTEDGGPPTRVSAAGPASSARTAPWGSIRSAVRRSWHGPLARGSGARFGAGRQLGPGWCPTGRRICSQPARLDQPIISVASRSSPAGAPAAPPLRRRLPTTASQAGPLLRRLGRVDARESRAIRLT